MLNAPIDPNATFTNPSPSLTPIDFAPNLTPSSTAPFPIPMNSAVRQVAFVDAGLTDVDTLFAGITLDADLYLFDPTSDALSQITSVLTSYSDLTAIQIFSHGSNGALQLGNTNLNAENLIDYAGLLQTWAGALSADGDLLIYGCNVAADAIGQDFVTQIATLTGADVAASIDLTGNGELGGDWALEFTTGSIETADPLQPWAQAAYQGLLQITSNGITNITVDEDALPTTIDLSNAFSSDVTPASDLVFTVASSNTDLFSNISIDQGILTLTYAPNANGTTTLTVQATDPSDQSITDSSFTVTLNAVNDAPIITAPLSQTLFATSTSQAISGISINDIDAGTGLLSTTLTVNFGNLNFADLNGATITDGALDSNSITLSGTLTQLNQALATLRYDPNFFNGNANLNISVTDSESIGGHLGTVSQNTISQNMALELANNAGSLNIASFAVNSTIDPNDTIDRYRFTLADPTDNFRIFLGFMNANHDVYLRNSAGTVLQQSNNSSLNAENITGVSLDSGEYFIEVRRVGPSIRNKASYRLLFWR
jgi:hypothetical protein